MKTIQLLIVLVLMFGGVVSVQAQCPVHKTTIFYINGVNAGGKESDDSKDKLSKELLAYPNINPECVAVKAFYNISHTLPLDFIESAIQKFNEAGFDIRDFWKLYLRVAWNDAGPLFLSLLDDFYHNKLNGSVYVYDDQLQEFIGRVRNALNQGDEVILVPHSQGNFYANLIWDALAFSEQLRTHIVAVATPSDFVADGGNYTTVDEDVIAHWFPLALPANAANPNPEECLNEWLCHGFKEWYLTGSNSKTRIINDIVSLLPQQPKVCAVEGVVYTDWYTRNVVPGASVVIRANYNNSPAIDTAITNVDGYYCILENEVLRDKTVYRMDAYINGNLFDTRFVYIEKGFVEKVDFPRPVLI